MLYSTLYGKIRQYYKEKDKKQMWSLLIKMKCLRSDEKRTLLKLIFTNTSMNTIMNEVGFSLYVRVHFDFISSTYSLYLKMLLIRSKWPDFIHEPCGIVIFISFNHSLWHFMSTWYVKNFFRVLHNCNAYQSLFTRKKLSYIGTDV